MMKVTPESTKDVVVARKIVDLTKFEIGVTNRQVLMLDVEKKSENVLERVEVEFTCCVSK